MILISLFLRNNCGKLRFTKRKRKDRIVEQEKENAAILDDMKCLVVGDVHLAIEELRKAPSPKVCPECKESFLSKHIDTVYCSKSCKDKSWRHRNPRYNYEWFKQHPLALLETYEKRKSPIEREKHRQYVKNHYSSYYKQYFHQYSQRNREKQNAKHFAQHHTNLETQCEFCGDSKNLERHHPDYSEPLVVLTVCRSCHIYIHSGE